MFHFDLQFKLHAANLYSTVRFGAVAILDIEIG